MKARRLPNYPDAPEPGDWWWYGDHGEHAGIIIVLPIGELCMMPAGGKGWDVTGDGATITVRPSIYYNPPGPYHNPRKPTWHGFLTGGELEEC